MHRLLARQVKRHFGDEVCDEKIRLFLDVVQSSYEDYEKEKKLLENALANSVNELEIANKALLREKDSLLSIRKKALDAAGNMIIITDRSGKIEYANNLFFAFTGYGENDIIGQNTRILGTHFGTREIYKQLWTTIGSGEVWHGELYNKKKDGSIYPVEVSITPIFDGEFVTHYVAVEKDITERLNKEAELKAAMQKALEASKIKSEFLSTMSHEIRTPMNGIIGMAEILLGTELDKDQTEFAKIIRESADLLLAIVNDILDFSKMEAGKLAIEEVDFELKEVCRGVIRLLESKAKEKNLELIMDIDASVPIYVKADPVRIRQLILNLVGNAIKFTEKGFVKIKLEPICAIKDGFIIRFIVEDSGIGIAKEAQAKLFQSFTQADGSMTRKYGGTGLGLAICKKLVTLMDGDIGIVSQEGKGSKFWFELPLKIAQRNAQNMPHLKSTTEDCALANKKKILLAEDNIVNQKVAIIQLKKLGFSADIAENGKQALELAHANHYELILMDCQMPTMDGFEATRELRRQGFIKPIIATTANAMEGDKDICMSAGMDDYITKPIDTELLRQMLEKYIKNDMDELKQNVKKESQTNLLNKKRLSELFEDDIETAKEFMTVFVRSTDDIVGKAKAAFAMGDFDGLYRLGHSLKGSGANAGMDRVCRLGAELEIASKAKNTNRTDEIMQELEVIVDLIKEEADSF